MAMSLLFLTICTLTLCLYFTAGKSYEMNFLPPLLLLAVIGILGFGTRSYILARLVVGRSRRCLSSAGLVDGLQPVGKY